MAAHVYEQEQIEALKRWWRENGTSVVAGVVLGIAGIFAWNAWNEYQAQRLEQAAAVYAQLKNAALNNQYELAEGLAKRLDTDFASKAYADFARLHMAKVAAEQKRLEAAKVWLETILNTSKDEDLRHIARLRLARVLLDGGQPEAGVALLLADPGEFAGEYEEVKGDLYLAWGKVQEAKEAYRKAIALGRNHPYLKMKLNDLNA
nr:hypothetical conserved protein [uncultured Gammaproteobacteria bacterium]